MANKKNYIDYCLVLGLGLNAEQKEIAEAYRNLAKRWHPDKNVGIDTTLQMQLILEAYHYLKDEENRKQYLADFKRENLEETEAEYVQVPEIVVCYYCKKELADSNFSHHETLHRGTANPDAALSKSAIEYKEIKVPRCGKCYDIHQRKLSVLGFWMLGVNAGLTIWIMGYFSPLLGVLTGFFIAVVLLSINAWLITKETGIKREKNVNEYEPILVLRSEGWVRKRSKV
jgi:hypothetical protein